MTVAELVAMLQSLPQGALALVEGYETGFDAVHAVGRRQVEPYRHAQEWDGQFKENGRIDAVVILGQRGGRRQ